MQRPILVTGGAGYIGSHTCKALASRGFLPISFDSLVRGHRWAVRWGPLEEGDLLDRAALDRALRTHRPLAVIHFAAYAYVGESVSEPAKYYRNNVCGSLNLLEAMHANDCGRVLFSSSCSTYGMPVRLPLDEDHPQHPINPYGRTKLTIERMLADFEAAWGLRHINLRYFNAAGADPDLEIGEVHDPETHLIPLAIQAALEEGRTLSILGGDYDTPDGTAIRDYIHVSDLAEAHVLALERLLAGEPGDSYNLGTGAGHSVREVIGQVEKTLHTRVPVRIADRRPGDPPSLIASAGKARHTLGWRPRFPNLSDIVETACRWYEKGPPPEPSL